MARAATPPRRDERRDRDRRDSGRDRDRARDPAPPASRHRERSRSRERDRAGPAASSRQPRSRSRDRDPAPRKRERSREPKDSRDGRDRERGRERDSKKARRSRSREREGGSKRSRSRSRSREQRHRQNGSSLLSEVPRPVQEGLVEAPVSTAPKIEVRMRHMRFAINMSFMLARCFMLSPMLTSPLHMQPLSLEDLLKKKQIEQDEATKVRTADVPGKNTCVWLIEELRLGLLHLQPKFLSKKQREELALKRRADEVKEQRERYPSPPFCNAGVQFKHA